MCVAFRLLVSARRSVERPLGLYPPGRVKNEVRCYPKCSFFPKLWTLSLLFYKTRESKRAHTKKKKKIVDSRKESSSESSSSIARRRRGIEEVRDNRKNINTTNKNKRMKKELSQSVVEKLVWIAIYSLCSSSMLVVNKLAVAAIPLPTVVSGAQLVSSALVPLLMQVCGVPVIGKMTTGRVAPYVVYTSMFAAGLFANMKALLLTNVGAVIAARCCLPLIVSVIEYVFMGRSWPNKRSMVSLVRF